MAIDFFATACTTVTSEAMFGICDIPPATLDFCDAETWHVWVDNENGIEVTFTAIDKCLNIPFGEGDRCEAMMRFSDAIMFVELKDSDGASRWVGKSRDQLINTIRLFKRDADIRPFRRLYGHIANRQRPHFNAAGKKFFQEFEDETGFLLRVSNVIKID